MHINRKEIAWIRDTPLESVDRRGSATSRESMIIVFDWCYKTEVDQRIFVEGDRTTQTLPLTMLQSFLNDPSLKYQGHPMTVFCKTSARRSNYCLEFSITWGRLKMCRWQVRLFRVEKMKPKLSGFKNEIEREIRKCLTFVRRGECRRVELCSRKFILNFNQTNLES